MPSFLPKISIITVCFNAAAVITKTLESIRSQTVHPTEVIIIDGGSTDETMQIIDQYSDIVSWKVSEKDAGIYDAMNKGIKVAKGDYIFFLNAGDTFVSSVVIEEIIKSVINLKFPQLVFGNVIYSFSTYQQQRTFKHISALVLPHCDLCHQAVFAQRDLFTRLGLFDCKLRYAADFDWLLRVYRSGARGEYTDIDIVFYDSDGVSARNMDVVEYEKKIIVVKNYGEIRKFFGDILFKICRKVFKVGIGYMKVTDAHLVK